MMGLTVRDNKVYNFVQSTAPGTIFTSAVVPTFYSTNFTATTHINQFSSFAAVFDQYKITELEVWLTPSGPGTAPGYVQATTMKLYTVIDYDDSANLASTNAALQYQNVQIGRLDDGHYRRWRPHCAVAGYGGAFSSYLNIPAPWIDVASTAVQHYGLKIALDATTAANDVRIDMLIRVHVSFRNVF